MVLVENAVPTVRQTQEQKSQQTVFPGILGKNEGGLPPILASQTGQSHIKTAERQKTGRRSAIHHKLAFLDTRSYMDGIHSAEERGYILYFPDNPNRENYESWKYEHIFDKWKHLPYENPIYESIFDPKISLYTPPNKLLHPLGEACICLNGVGYPNQARDTPGGKIAEENSRKLSKVGEIGIRYYGGHFAPRWLELGAGIGVAASRVNQE
ncbi:MAG: hypothetical protein V1875_07960, partial [Candidatus Altiarchaeota archaeon]